MAKKEILDKIKKLLCIVGFHSWTPITTTVGGFKFICKDCLKNK